MFTGKRSLHVNQIVWIPSRIQSLFGGGKEVPCPRLAAMKHIIYIFWVVQSSKSTRHDEFKSPDPVDSITRSSSFILDLCYTNCFSLSSSGPSQWSLIKLIKQLELMDFNQLMSNFQKGSSHRMHLMRSRESSARACACRILLFRGTRFGEIGKMSQDVQRASNPGPTGILHWQYIHLRSLWGCL